MATVVPNLTVALDFSLKGNPVPVKVIVKPPYIDPDLGDTSEIVGAIVLLTTPESCEAKPLLVIKTEGACTPPSYPVTEHLISALSLTLDTVHLSPAYITEILF